MRKSFWVSCAALLAALFFSGCASESPSVPANLTTPSEALAEATATNVSTKTDGVFAQLENVTALSERRVLPILMFHHVSDRKRNDMTITKAKLEEVLRLLSNLGFVTILPDDWFAYCEGKKDLPEKICLLTFDDGWKNQYENAAPLLSKYGCRAVFYIYPDFIGGSAAMSWRQLKELARAGHVIGSHSYTHEKLILRKPFESKEDYAKRLAFECAGSAKKIVAQLGFRPKDFCYPYGYYSEDLFSALEKAGYRSAVSVNQNQNTKETDPFLYGRMQINQTTSQAAIKSYLESENFEVFLQSPADGSRVVNGPVEVRLLLGNSVLEELRNGATLSVFISGQKQNFESRGNFIVLTNFYPADFNTLTVKLNHGTKTLRKSFFFAGGQPFAKEKNR